MRVYNCKLIGIVGTKYALFLEKLISNSVSFNRVLCFFLFFIIFFHLHYLFLFICLIEFVVFAVARKIKEAVSPLSIED